MTTRAIASTVRHVDKLNVLMTATEYDVIKVGGLSAALTSLAEAMRKYANPRIVLPRSGCKVPWRKVGETNYEYADMEIFEHNGVVIYTLSNAILDDPQIYPEPLNVKAIKKIDEFGERLMEVVDDIDFDIVHMQDLFAYKAMARFKEIGKPVLLTIHRLHREHPNWFFAETVALEKAGFITVVGKSYYQEDEMELFKQYEGKVTHVFNGIDTKFWDDQKCSNPELSRRERRKKTLNSCGLNDGVFYLYVGRFDPVQKGVDILLRASQEFLKDEDARMILVGAGDRMLENRSKELEREYPTILKAINRLLPREEVRDLYSSADFSLVPSLFEPFGLVQLEAMSCGCIPIGSRTGGIKDTIISYDDDKVDATGFLVEKGNADTLLQTMRRSLNLHSNEPKLIGRMRKNGKKRCRRYFRWDVSCQQYVKLYKKLLAVPRDQA